MDIMLGLLDIVDEQHTYIDELLELVARGHKMDADAITEARQRQSEISSKLTRIRESVVAEVASPSGRSGHNGL